MNYYAPEIAMPSVSFYKAIADHDPDVPAGFFQQQSRLCRRENPNTLAMERKDEYSTPFSYIQDNAYKWMSGVTIHATAFLNFIRGDYLRRFDWRLNML
jgi:hypothetical protein